MKAPVQQVLTEIEDLRSHFRDCRAHFPFLPPEAVGALQFVTAPYYTILGFHVTFKYDHPLTTDERSKHNAIGHWINQNVVVRLCALMEYHGMFSNAVSIDQTIDGWKELDLARRLRQVFAHKAGQFNPSDHRERRLMEELIAHFDLHVDAPEAFPLDIDKVIDPLFEGCKRYVKGKNA